MVSASAPLPTPEAAMSALGVVKVPLAGKKDRCHHHFYFAAARNGAQLKCNCCSSYFFQLFKIRFYLRPLFLSRILLRSLLGEGRGTPGSSLKIFLMIKNTTNSE
jgi:hypothetical protein